MDIVILHFITTMDIRHILITAMVILPITTIIGILTIIEIAITLMVILMVITTILTIETKIITITGIMVMVIVQTYLIQQVQETEHRVLPTPAMVVKVRATTIIQPKNRLQ
jgi:hypothetical protein